MRIRKASVRTQNSSSRKKGAHVANLNKCEIDEDPSRKKAHPHAVDNQHFESDAGQNQNQSLYSEGQSSSKACK
jgi:hypothetical protein